MRSSNAARLFAFRLRRALRHPVLSGTRARLPKKFITPQFAPLRAVGVDAPPYFYGVSAHVKVTPDFLSTVVLGSAAPLVISTRGLYWLTNYVNSMCCLGTCCEKTI